MKPYRCVIFAGVSGKPQAADDRDSIPNQIERARDVIERRGWSESCEPLIFPGHTRSIDFLHEAIEDIPAVADLIRIARQGEIDIVICRDYDRMARTRALLTQLSSYLSRCRVQIYALDKPVEPVHPDELGRRGKGVQSAALVEAFAGIQAEGEISQIVSRRYFGMNATMRAGKWRHVRIAYGYTRLAEHSTDEQPIYLDVPRLVPEQVSIVKRIEQMFLDGTGSNVLARTLNYEQVPSSSGKGQWRGTTVLYILKNVFYCGYTVWGLTRATTVLNPSTNTFATRPRPVAIIQELKRRLGHQPTLFDLLDHADELAREDVIIVRGQQQAIRSEKTQREIYAELERRRVMGGRAASTAGEKPLLFSGLLFCAYCGSPLLAVTNRSGHNRVYYICRARRTGQLCANKKYGREIRLYESVMEIINQIALTPGAVDNYLQKQVDRDLVNLKQEYGELERGLAGLDQRRARWDNAYEASAIDLETYSERITALEHKRNDLEHRLSVIEQMLSRKQTLEERREEILEDARHPPPPDDRAAIKIYLRRIIEKIILRDGQIERIIMRG